MSFYFNLKCIPLSHEISDLVLSLTLPHKIISKQHFTRYPCLYNGRRRVILFSEIQAPSVCSVPWLDPNASHLDDLTADSHHTVQHAGECSQAAPPLAFQNKCFLSLSPTALTLRALL